MTKKSPLLFWMFLTLLMGCATGEPTFEKSQTEPAENYTGNKEKITSFYLIGDAGYSQPGGSSDALQALKTYLGSVNTSEDFVIFLGDNLYPGGMVSKEDDKRESREYLLDAQLDAVENFKGQVVFLPGNHDWQKEGIDGLQRQQEYLEQMLGSEEVYFPKPGCPLQFVDISDDTHLIILDSQWYLEHWDDHPTVNDNCPEIKTREAMFLEVETELKKNQNKTTVFAMHHPLNSNGIFGGKSGLSMYLDPAHKRIPAPVIGSVVNFVRASGGISKQDLQNERYSEMVSRLRTIADKWGNVVFASGHDHSLQYVENEHIKQIISGAGSTTAYAEKGTDGLFAYTGQGFAVFDVFKDGSSRVSFYGSKGSKPELLYQKEVFGQPDKFDVESLPQEFPETVEASVYKPEETQKSDLYKSIWGDKYRELYSRKIEARVALLDTLYGGLEPMREGGGHQTTSLRVKDSLDREYNFRMLRKDAVQFIQAVGFKDEPISEDFKNTLAEKLLEDFYTGSHPYGFLAVPVLAEAADVLYTNPQLFYLPKQPKLGDYNFNHGGALYMVEERPEENWLGYDSFGNPNHDLESTEGMFERLRRDEKYSLDEAAYVRSRLFDMLIGDWDRHSDQWRWAEIEDEDDNRTFLPIPRDRDQVFSNFDGSLFNTLRKLVGFTNQFGQYDEDIDDIEWFNKSATAQDRALLQNSGKETWKEQAEFLQSRITDEVIDEAFARLPEEVQGQETEELKEKVRARRAKMVDISMRYYEVLAKLAIITGTDKDDFIDVTRMGEGKTKVTLSRNKDGERDDVISEKIYYADETEEIWIYGLDDDDQFFVDGKGNDEILVRIIGGQNNDVYHIENGKKIKVYDHKSKPNTVEKNKGARITFTDNYEVNLFDKDRKKSNSNSILPSIGYNPDDGVILGVHSAYTINKLITNPFTARHKFSAGYFFATQGFEVAYEGEFANSFSRYNLGVGAYYSSPKNTLNFFGLGNETVNYDDDLTKDYNRIRISRLGVELGIIKDSPYGSFFKYAVNFEGVEVEDTEGRYLSEEFAVEDEFFERKYYIGLEGNYGYESFDDVLNPTKGMDFEVALGGKMDVQDTHNAFIYIKPSVEFYHALTRNRKWVLNSRALAEINLQDDFRFYHAATLGGDNGLRGFRHQRFAGKEAFAAGADLRYSFEKFTTGFLPFQIGIFGGYDVGRVWIENENSDKWHDSYGGGFWVSSAETVSGKFNFFTGGEGLRFSFGVMFDL